MRVLPGTGKGLNTLFLLSGLLGGTKYVHQTTVGGWCDFLLVL